MTIWVWATDPDDAIIRCENCQDYKTREEAIRKRNSESGLQLFKVEVTTETV